MNATEPGPARHRARRIAALLVGAAAPLLVVFSVTAGSAPLSGLTGSSSTAAPSSGAPLPGVSGASSPSSCPIDPSLTSGCPVPTTLPGGSPTSSASPTPVSGGGGGTTGGTGPAPGSTDGPPALPPGIPSFVSGGVIFSPALGALIPPVTPPQVGVERPALHHFDFGDQGSAIAGGGGGAGSISRGGDAPLQSGLLFAMAILGVAALITAHAFRTLGMLPRITLPRRLARRAERQLGRERLHHGRAVLRELRWTPALLAPLGLSAAMAIASAAPPAALAGVRHAPAAGEASSGQAVTASRQVRSGDVVMVTLISIERRIAAEQATLDRSRQAAPPPVDELRPATTPAQSDQLLSELSALESDYQAALQQEYDFYVKIAQDPTLRDQLIASVQTAPAQIRDTVTYNLQAVETQLAQEAAIQAAQQAPAGPALPATAPTHLQTPEGGQITQGFGPTSFTLEPPLTYNGTYYPHFHTGLDIGAARGTPVGAAAPGRVILAGSSRDANGNLVGYGNYVVIAHGGGMITLYGHLDVITVTQGQAVAAGQVIGLEGSTGWSTGPHLHFEVRVNGQYLDPAPFLSTQLRPA